MKIVQQSVELLWVTPDAEKVIERAGRTCYKSEAKITEESAGAFCRKMVASGHHAMIEHASASFLITTDRGISHEIVRHRIASYAQESTRYCNYGTGKFGNEISVVDPGNWPTEATRNRWLKAMISAEYDYLELIADGVSPQIARSVLPTSLKTEIVMTANFREWRHFITLRGSAAAHPQIRLIAEMLRVALTRLAPNVFYDLAPICIK